MKTKNIIKKIGIEKEFRNNKSNNKEHKQNVSKDKDLILSDFFLIKISIILSLIGILLLFILSNNSNLEIVTPSNFHNYNDEEEIILKGKFHSYEQRGSITILKIYETIVTDVIIFDSFDINEDLNNDIFNKELLIRGIIRDSKYGKNIYATSIRFEN